MSTVKDPGLASAAKPTTYVKSIDGLPTTGPMGTAPTITVGVIITAATIVLQVLSVTTGFEPPAEVRSFFDEHGVAIAGVVAALVTAGITYFRVFSPESTAKIAVGRELPRLKS